MHYQLKMLLSLGFVGLVCAGAGGDGCTRTPVSAAQIEQATQNRQMDQFLRNQPVPSFDWSLERHMMLALYTARQHATNTFSVVQSEFTGKVLWSCPSIGFPLPYATQLTNPEQVVFAHHPTEHDASGVVSQQEPNGLFTPSTADGTWVPCVDEKGKIVPVYEERKVTTFLRPMVEKDGILVPKEGSVASLTIEPSQR
jgi:hypothetical protein